MIVLGEFPRMEKVAVRRKLALVNIAAALALLSSFIVLSGGAVAARPIHASKIKVTIAGWDSTGTEAGDLQKVINAFEKANPKYSVKLYEYSGSAYPDTIQAAIAAGGGPDIFYVNNDKFRQWQQAKALYPLNNFINHDTAYRYWNMDKSLRNAFTVGGKVYGIDKDYSDLALFVNSGMFKAAKLKTAPKSWSQFASDACAIRKYEVKHHHPNVYGAGLANDEWRWQSLLQSLHGSVLNKAQNKATFETKAAITAINDYANLVKKGCAKYYNSTEGWSGAEFLDKTAAMVFEGPWLIAPIAQTDPGLRYTIAPLPYNGNLLFTVCYSMNPHAPNKAAAWKLLSYLTGRVGEQKWVNLFKVLPARTDVKPAPGDKPFLETVQSAYTVLPRPHWTDTGNSPYNVLNDDLKSVSEGKMTAKAMTQDVTNAINAWLSQYGK
jgi:multiple sugar transport system substrate-binding protein